MSMRIGDTDAVEGPTDWGVSRTKQSEEPHCNINNIIKMFTKTGELTHISRDLGEFRDISGVPDLAEALNIVADAKSSFMELPAEIRKLCDHDVGKFLPYIDNPDNFDKCVELGLLAPKPKQKAEAISVPTPQPDGSVQGGE